MLLKGESEELLNKRDVCLDCICFVMVATSLSLSLSLFKEKPKIADPLVFYGLEEDG